MKESIRNIHMEALHCLSGIPFDSDIGIRANKVNVLEKLGFSKGTNIALIKEFDASHKNGMDGLQKYLLQQLEHGRFISMLFNGMGWESLGGSPVVYVMSKEDMDRKLVFRKSNLVRVSSQEGKNFEVNKDVRLQTYSRQRSIELTIGGFDNCTGETRINAGGGFRLQLDDISIREGRLKFTFSSHFSFNDMGSRVLALSSEDDKKVPRYSSSFQTEVVDGRLVYIPSTQKGLADIKHVVDLSDILIKNLFDTDGAAISLLYRYLLSVRPCLKTHQLEGIFSITNKNGVSTEVIDFDGIDIFDLGGKNLQLGPIERLTAAHLKMTDYTLTDSQQLISYVQFIKNVDTALAKVTDSKILPDQIKNIIKKIVVPKSENIFGNDFFGSIKLARLLKSLGIYIDGGGNSEIRRIQTTDGELFIISIEGFDMAFLQKEGKLIDCTDIKKQRAMLSRSLGIDIIDVHFSYIREGD